MEEEAGSEKGKAGHCRRCSPVLLSSLGTGGATGLVLGLLLTRVFAGEGEATTAGGRGG